MWQFPPNSVRGSVYESPPRSTGGFSLLELLVATTVLAIIIGIVLKLTNQTSEIWTRSASKIQAFQDARGGFESMTRSLSQATVRTYYDYYDSSKQARRDIAAAQLVNFVPDTYDRISDLHFVAGQAKTLLSASPTAIITQTHGVFFQTPLGYSVTYATLDNALNGCGYYLAFDSDKATVPPHIAAAPGFKERYRFRLMEMMQPTEDLQIFANGPSAAVANKWFTQNAAACSRPIAENIIALVLLPKLSDRDDDPANTTGNGVSLAPNYQFNSRIPLGATTDPTWPGATPPFPGDGFKRYPPGVPSGKDATRHHQLPPILKVLLVAIDEPSAIRLQDTAGTGVPNAINLSATTLFQEAKNMAKDLQSLEDICNAQPGNLTGNTLKLNYRIFSADILMREAKWSND